MNSSATAGTSTSTLSGASVNTAEGNDFTNIGHNMVKFENVGSLTINTYHATGDSISEVREDASPGPIIATGNTFVTLATLLTRGGVFGRKASETNPISSGNAPQQSTPDDDARDQTEPRTSVTEIQDITTSPPLSVLDTVNSTVSPSTQSSSAERYIRSLLECNQGYPLFEPEPDPKSQYFHEGVRVGDVGLITDDGGFDFLFNVCLPSDASPDELPDNFEMLRSPEILVKAHFQSKTRLFNKEVKRTEEPDIKYTCSGPEGGVLELPQGATRFEARNKRSFKRLATRHAKNWYKFAVLTKDREASNGSLYIVTTCIKCTDWGIAVFDRPSNDQDCLRFITNEKNQNEQSKYRWKGYAHQTKVVPNGGNPGSNDADGPNQCVFLRGYKIMLPGDIWDDITNSEFTGTSSVRASPDSPHSGNKSESPRQGDSNNHGDSSQSRADSGSGPDCGTTRATQNTYSRTDKSARISLYEYSKASPVHPSDLINAMLLRQEPKAKVALTHDDDWCDLLQYHSQILDSDAIAKVCLPYTSKVDEYGCASLERSDHSPNVIVVESNPDICVTSTLENHLPTDSDNSAVVRQRSSTPHSQCSHQSILSITATVGSDVNRTLAHGQSSQASGVHGYYPYPTAVAGSSGQLASPQKTILHPNPAGSDDFAFDTTHSSMSEEEDDETSEHDYISTQESADIELPDADKPQLSFERDQLSPLGESQDLRSFPKLVKGVGNLSSTSTDQLHKACQFHPPLDRSGDIVHFTDFYPLCSIDDSPSQSSVKPSASGPPVIKLEAAENDLRRVGSRQIQQAAGRRRKKDGVYQCTFCQATFTARCNLRYHINAHFGLRPYKCGQCAYAAASPSNINRHRKSCRLTSQHTEQDTPVESSIDS